MRRACSPGRSLAVHLRKLGHRAAGQRRRSRPLYHDVADQQPPVVRRVEQAQLGTFVCEIRTFMVTHFEPLCGTHTSIVRTHKSCLVISLRIIFLHETIYRILFIRHLSTRFSLCSTTCAHTPHCLSCDTRCRNVLKVSVLDIFVKPTHHRSSSSCNE